LEILHGSGRKIVDDIDIVPRVNQLLREMAADKAGAARDCDFLGQP
jgi:hypothetical protein